MPARRETQREFRHIAAYVDFNIALEYKGGRAGRDGLIVAHANSKLSRDMADPVRRQVNLEDLRNLFDKLAGPDIRVADLSDAGNFMGELLLVSEIQELFHEAYSALPDSEGVRLRVRCKDDVMKQVPWEFARINMGDGSVFTPLAVNPRLSIVRYEELRFPPPAPELRTILMVSALDAGRAGGKSYPELPTNSLDAPRFYGALPVQVISVDPPTKESLKAALRDQQVDIFHFWGHGERSKGTAGRSGLVIDYPDGRGADILTGEKLVPILDRAGVTLAVLGACHSGEYVPGANGYGVAEALVHAGIPIVVAMQHRIEASHMAEFNQRFYASLFNGATVDEAVSRGRIRLHEIGAHYGRPILYHRSDSGAFLT